MSLSKKQVKTRKLSAADYIRKHSPIKKGMRISDEDKPVASFNKIMSKIYLGNYQAAKDSTFFKEHKIKAVLNCSKDIPNHFQSQKDIEYMRIHVDDSLKEVDFKKMYEFLPSMVEFIYKHAILQKHPVFIHCHAGRQRSCCAIAAYLISKYGMTTGEACRFISDKRIEAFHFQKSLNFDQALDLYYKDIQKCKKTIVKK